MNNFYIFKILSSVTYSWVAAELIKIMICKDTFRYYVDNENNLQILEKFNNINKI